jgi:hypothetical protein
MTYRPQSPGSLTIDAGHWQATGQPIVKVTIVMDNRLLVWAVNAAAKRPEKTFQINNGKPPFTLQLDLL